MKPHILQYLRCPKCLALLRLDTNTIEIVERDSAARLAPCSGLCSSSGLGQHHHGCMECTQIEVMSGTLACTSCSNRYPIDQGIPKLVIRDSSTDDVVKARTARTFGYLWGRVGAIDHMTSRPYHFEKMSSALSLPALTGLVLDAGCGEGIDLANQARDPSVEVIGVELSDGGCHTSFARVVQLELHMGPLLSGMDYVHSERRPSTVR
ncbi:MAG TPA: class I SAM-dependent methyltransferase [Gemmatimonadetes bacterium]|nr:class I SAM-dependent methyltransferase [Gemmatimonadota bacterium]